MEAGRCSSSREPTAVVYLAGHEERIERPLSLLRLLARGDMPGIRGEGVLVARSDLILHATPGTCE